MTSIAIFNLETWNFETKQEKLLSCNRNRKRTKKCVSFWYGDFFGTRHFQDF
jgi:hypothetical protein